MLELNVESIDLELSSGGQWFDYGDEDSGIRFLIASSRNDAYKKLFRKHWKSNQIAIEKETLGDDKATDMMVEIEATTILLSWEGLTNGGEPFEPTLENRKALLGDEAYVELHQWVDQKSKDLDNYRGAEVKK